jgi:rhodanese-related sulfurtransferase
MADHDVLHSETYVDCASLRKHLLGNAEIAVLDVREARQFARAHINLSSHQSISFLDATLADVVPRKSTPIVVVDEDGGSIAARARAKIIERGYSIVRILQGGIHAWEKSGFAIGSGYNTVVKAFADIAHQKFSTPTITPEELRQRLAEGASTTIIDCRPQHEHAVLSIENASNAPGVELGLYDFNSVGPEHLWVISCFSRTRGIVGTNTLSLLRAQKNVAFLEDGIMAAVLHGLPTGPGRGIAVPAPLASDHALARDANDLVVRHRLNVIDRTQYEALRAESEHRTLYVFDVRPEAAYHNRHVPGSLSAPGGQLLMTYDIKVATRRARIVLVDEANLFRAAVTAFWLSHFDDAEIFIFSPNAEDFSAPSAVPDADTVPDAPRLAPAELASWLHEGKARLLDVGPSLAFEQGHIPDAQFLLREALPGWLHAHHPSGTLVFTSPDGANATYAAAETRRISGVDAYVLQGGTQAWRAAGYPIGTGYEVANLLSPFDDDWGSPMRLKGGYTQPFRDYLEWERQLGHCIAADDTVRFRW